MDRGQGSRQGKSRWTTELGTHCLIVTESGVRLLATQKPIKRPGWWKGNCFILDAGNRGMGRVDACPKADSTPTPTPTPRDNQWATAFIDRGRGPHAETAQSALTVILKLVICALISVLLIVLSTVSLQVQGPFFPYFSEANSQNCGSLCHGYSLVIMLLTSSTWWGFQYLQDSSGNGSEYYLQSLRRN